MLKAKATSESNLFLAILSLSTICAKDLTITVMSSLAELLSSQLVKKENLDKRENMDK
jgi:hypothetical protein